MVYLRVQQLVFDDEWPMLSKGDSKNVGAVGVHATNEDNNVKVNVWRKSSQY